MSLPSSSYSKLPRALRLLAQHGAAALRPSLEKGRYIAPMIPRRIAADVRKRAIVQGTYGSFSLPIGGWDPAWDETKKMFVMKPYKGHIRDRTRKERAEKVTAAMKTMPDKIIKYEQDVKERKPKKDILFMFKRIAEFMKKGKGGKP